MHRVKDHVFAIPTPRVAGDDITATANDHLIDIAPKPDYSVPVGDWHRVVIGLVAHQGLRVHLAGGLITGVKRGCGQIHHRGKVTRKTMPDAIAVPAQDIRLAFAALVCQPDVQGVPCRKARDGHHEVAPGIPNLAFNRALVVAFAGPTIAVMDEVVRQEPAEQLGPLACAIRKYLRHQAPVIVIKNRLRHPTEEGKGMDMAVDPGLGYGRRICANKARIAVGQIQRKEVCLLFNTADHNHHLAKIRLGMASSMGKRNKHLPAAPAMFTEIILDRRVAALEAVLVP